METDPILVFGKLLKALRERAGMSQRQLADIVNYSASLISAIETGTKPAKSDLVRRLDQALNAGGALLTVWPITTVGNVANSGQPLLRRASAARWVHGADVQSVRNESSLIRARNSCAPAAFMISFGRQGPHRRY